VPPGPQATAPAPNTTPREATVPSGFLGRKVTVSGQVDQVLGPRVFTLAGVKGSHDLLVVSKDEKAPAPKKGENVEVTGTVEKYEAAEVHHQTGADVGKVPADEFAGRPVVIASSVLATPAPG
jgi:DNA/RNA endonuclease YhcR with UshA esterase domain